MLTQFSALAVGAQFRFIRPANNDGRLDVVFTKINQQTYRAPNGSFYRMTEPEAEVRLEAANG